MHCKVKYQAACNRVLKRVPHKNLKNISEILNNLFISQIVYGNFTVINLQTHDGDIAGTGIAKRNPIDINDPAVGYNIALHRAIENVIDSYSKTFKSF